MQIKVLYPAKLSAKAFSPLVPHRFKEKQVGQGVISGDGAVGLCMT